MGEQKAKVKVKKNGDGESFSDNHAGSMAIRSHSFVVVAP
jgi:hypothetical protein